jgi:hypothetical protein
MNERIKKLAEQTGVTMENVYSCYDKEIERFADIVRQDERSEREWCGNAENPVKCIGHNDLCRGFTCKHFAEFLYEKNRTLSQEIDRLKTSKDLCGND